MLIVYIISGVALISGEGAEVTFGIIISIAPSILYHISPTLRKNHYFRVVASLISKIILTASILVVVFLAFYAELENAIVIVLFSMYFLIPITLLNVSLGIVYVANPNFDQRIKI
mmetsp:Transcript_22557/g.20034  ORF Transcript_22557/g.20034 Transcript_22557/m.20034 type:complete len:115 (+) Transcript_22557:88-432(+)